jgi:hypothetical protein
VGCSATGCLDGWIKTDAIKTCEEVQFERHALRTSSLDRGGGEGVEINTL